MVTWKKALGYMDEEFHHAKLAEEEQFDPDYKADEEEFLSSLRNRVSATIEDHSAKPKAESTENIAYKKTKTSKRFIVLAASLVLVIGLGATGIGSNSYVISVVNMILGGKTAVRVDTNDLKKLSGEDTTAEDARANINKMLGIRLVKMNYLPHLMEYEKSTINFDNTEAEITYNDPSKNELTLNISKKETRSPSVDETVDRLMQKYNLQVKNYDITIKEYENSETEKKQLIATFSDEYAFYSLNSNINQKEFDKIIKSLFFD